MSLTDTMFLLKGVRRLLAAAEAEAGVADRVRVAVELRGGWRDPMMPRPP